jgi:nucleotide-binding universal stress UspA family protein
MPIKTIFVPLSDAEGAAKTLNAAIGLAEGFGAAVNVVHLRADPTQALGDFVGESVSPQLVEEVLTQAEKRATAIAAAARKAYDAAAKTAKGVKLSYSESTINSDVAVETQGRLSDIVVVRRASGTRDVGARVVAEAALMGTGRPVLVLPTTPPAKIGTSVVIAWNDSLEASKAVNAALPFLTRATRVSVISANAESAIDQKGIIAYLGTHGVKARGVSVKAGADAGKAIVSAATRAKANLLVMGAYSHSRVREMIFGGVTEHALSSARLPILLVH